MRKPKLFAAASVLLFLTSYNVCWAHAIVVDSNPREGAVLKLWLIKQPASRVAWSAAIAAALLLMASGAWLVHAVGRLEGTVPLMLMTVLHQLGAAVGCEA